MPCLTILNKIVIKSCRPDVEKKNRLKETNVIKICRLVEKQSNTEISGTECIRLGFFVVYPLKSKSRAALPMEVVSYDYRQRCFHTDWPELVELIIRELYS